MNRRRLPEGRHARVAMFPQGAGGSTSNSLHLTYRYVMRSRDFVLSESASGSKFQVTDTTGRSLWAPLGIAEGPVAFRNA